MKILLLVYCCFSLQILIAQPILFEGSDIDTIEITASTGGAWFGDNRGYSVNSEVLCIAFDTKKQRYRVVNREEHYTFRTYEPDVREESTDGKSFRKRIDVEALEYLIAQLQIRDSLLTFADLDISPEQWKEILSEKYIRKEFEKDGTFVHSEKEAMEIAAIQSVDTFNLYLKKEIPPPNVVTIVTDASDSYEIHIVLKNGDNVTYGAYAGTVFRQPWEKRINDTLAEGFFNSKYYNLKINLALLTILPKNFYQITTVDPARLVRIQYLDWYLRRRHYRY